MTNTTRNTIFIAGGAALILVVALVWFLPGTLGQKMERTAVFEVKRGDLRISVIEQGKLKALNSLSIKSEVEGQTEILKIVSEGTIITQKDVDDKTVLIELDSKDLRDEETQQDISLLNAEAAFTQANENLQIQLLQNESDIKAGELNKKFARMDLEKYLGKKLATRALEQKDETAAPALGEDIGGGALQQKRILESDIDLAKEEVSLAQNTLKWTKQLHAKGFVTGDELEADTLALKRKIVAAERAQTALDIFRKYEFPKEVEKFLSDYREAERELERIEASTRSRTAQAGAEKKSKEATYNLQKRKLEKIREQIAKCTIVATKPGLVIYHNDGDWRRPKDPIEAGTTVRQGQALINLPDLSQMSVNVNVDQSVFRKVKRGQEAYITLEAFRDMRLIGWVEKIALVSDSNISRFQPDLTVYPTQIIIEGEHKGLTSGMPGKVEIIVEELKDVLFVPVQAIHLRKEEQVCYVLKNGYYEARPVMLGNSNDSFVHVIKGLVEGDKMLVREIRPNERVKDVEANFTQPKKEPGKDKSKEKTRPDDRKPKNDKPDKQGGMREITSKLLPEEREELSALMQSEEGRKAFQQHKSAMEGLSTDEKVEYIRKHILNQK